MRRAPYVAALLLAALSPGCAAAPPPPAEETGLPFIQRAAPPAALPPAALEEAAPAPPMPPMPPRPGEDVGPCPLRWEPREFRASVLVLPAELAGRMMTPLYAAICACTRPGQDVMVVARLIPERGEVTAVTAARDEPGSMASPAMDACLAAHLGRGIYEPFRVGSDSICDAPAAAEQAPGAPARFQFPRPACASRDDAVTTILYPLRVDRRQETAARPATRE